MTSWLLDGVISWLAERVVDLLGGLVSLLAASLFLSPDVTVFPQVQHFAGRALMVVDAGFVLAILTAGFIIIGHGTFQIQYQAKDLLPRLVVGFVAAHFGIPLCRAVIEVANALTTALVEPTASGPEVVAFVEDRLNAVRGPGDAVASPTGLVGVVIGLIIVIQLYGLVVSWIVRLATLMVLAGTAPLALACYALPYTQQVAALWWRTLLGCLAVPALQAWCFSTGVNLLLDPNLNPAQVLGLGPAVTDLFNLLVAATIFMVTLRIPRLVGRFVTHGGQMSTAGVVLRTVVVQSVTRRLPIPVRR